MAPLLTAQSVSKRFGAVPLFENLSLTVNEGDRIGLIGPNGAGKSTLLALLAGEEKPDSGEVVLRKRARVSHVRQDSKFTPDVTVRGVVEAAMEHAAIPHEEREQRLREALGRAGFVDQNTGGAALFDAPAASLSGGWRKRLALIEAIVLRPDVLLLDEPTNHLDIDGIEWLEQTLATSSVAVVVVTHDRYFLENAANEIVELSRVYSDGLLRVRGGYSRFLETREAYRESQERVQEGLRNRVRTEIEWLRRGPKARATKAKARIDNAHALIGKLADVDERLRVSATDLTFEASERQTKRLLEMDHAAITLGDREIVHDLSFVLTNGAKLGIVGPNGSGKTTILRAMTGEVPVSSGRLVRAGALRTAYLSQMRQLDPALTLWRTLAPNSDSVVYQDRVVHVAGYAAKFLFTGDQLNQPVERLSGGERARVLLARLMLQPADVLILDEPTNDLDIPTLEILEEALLDFAGALVLVTHDRYMLDRVTESVLGLDGRGNAALFASFAQWEEWRAVGSNGGRIEPPVAPVAGVAANTRKKLSYIEQREYDSIDARIQAADERLENAKTQLADPSVVIDAEALTNALAELESAQAEHDLLIERWVELSEKVG
ncbi:MAG TPA: ABC-F family ATP-binding cassette domain-containing protein [Acidobacteriaceae bacterium]